jgi:acyl-coenzyme A thioesterase PaaI-like protein
VLAVEFKLNLLAPAQGEGFLACGRVLRAGRTLTVCQVDVFTTGAGERTPIATMLSTVIVRPIERGLSSRERRQTDESDSTERVIEP